MARSNPIGLAEPSVKRDGYAVSRDGSFYRSSENMFENKPQKQVIHCYIMDLIAEKKSTWCVKDIEGFGPKISNDV